MKEKVFQWIATLAIKRAWFVLLVSVILFIVSADLAGRLELKMNFKDLMPQDHPTVLEFNNIIDHFQGASTVIVGAIGEEEDLIQFVTELAPEIESLKSHIKRVEYKVNQNFIGEHGFMLTKAKDLKTAAGTYEDLGLIPFLTGINNSFEETYISDGEESISNKEKELSAISQLDGLKTWINTMQAYIEDSNLTDEKAREAVEKMMIGEKYFLSPDKDMIMLIAYPTFPVDEMGKATVLIHSLDSLIQVKLDKYPEIVLAGATGTMAMGVDETDAVSADMSYTSLFAFLLIFILFVISFRMWSAPILATISLIIGITWTAGFAYLTLGSLNMLTSMFAIILIGLGIDFNIHVISTYNQLRASKITPYKAIRMTFTKSASGILTGALTTAMAFLTLMISENAGMKEFGLIAGTGVLFSMAASLLVLPSLLVTQEKIRDRKTNRLNKKLIQLNSNDEDYRKLKNKISRRGEIKTSNYPFLGNIANRIANIPLTVIGIIVVITVLLGYSATKIKFNYDLLSLEPEGLKSIIIQDSMLSKFDTSPDIVMITTESVEEARSITEKAKDLRKISMVNSISELIPSDEQQEQRKIYLEKIRSYLQQNEATAPIIEDKNLLIDELYRLEDNIIEFAQMAFAGGQDRIDKKCKEVVGDLDVDAAERKSMITALTNLIDANPEASILALQAFQEKYEPVMREKALNMCSTEKITLETLPSDIRDQYVSDDGKYFLVSMYPKEQVWNQEFLDLFSEQMHKIDDRVTGLPLILKVLIYYMGKDGSMAAIAAIIVIFLILLIDFRSIKMSLITLIPLTFGVVWMVGIMHITGVQLNIVNVIGVPLILGMGIDTGVHIIHRYNIEGTNKIRIIFSTTGKAVLISSLTTFLAFGSLGFATHRGLASLGTTLAIGITTVWLSTIVLLPAIISLIDTRKVTKNISKEN
ncbi:MAG: MMPL family transporter [Bacteroidales bacterium]|nr:MMPL family transporter [Bacteroidales bacterium]